MADSFEWKALIEFAVKGAAAAGADVKGLIDRIEDLGDAGRLTDKEVDKLSKSAISAGKAAAGSASGYAKLSTELQAAAKAYRQLEQESVVAGKGTGKTIGSFDTAELQNYVDIHKAGTASIVADAQKEIAAREQAGNVASQQTALYNQYLFEEEKARNKVTAATEKQAQALLKTLPQQDAHVQAFREQQRLQETASQQTALYNQYLYDEARALEKASAANADHAESLNSMRYALYDVSQVLAIFGTAVVGSVAAVVGTSISFQDAFSNVARTAFTSSERASGAVEELKDQFVALSTSIPVSFEDLAGIGALGGQLNVANEDLLNFTKTVAMFSATTDVSTEMAAESLGRVGQLIQDQNYDRLASSILTVGVNAVATESDILKVATQISGIAKFAGLASDEVIGFASALASAGIRPELSRGLLTNVFTKITNAVNDGGEALNRFGEASGMSGAEFAQAWSQDKGDTFVQFLKGIKESGTDGVNVLKGLGIVSRQDQPSILKLAGSWEAFADQLDYAAEGYANVGNLQEAFNVKSATVASRLQVMAQSFQAFLAQLGESSLGPLGDVLDGVTAKFKALTALFDNPVGGWIAGAALALAALVGVIALVTAGIAVSLASMAAMQTAIAGVSGQAVVAGIGLTSLRAQLLAAGGAGAVASKGLGLAAVAMKALSIAALAVAIPDLTNLATKGIGDLTGYKTDLDSSIGKLNDDNSLGSAKKLAVLTDGQIKFARANENLVRGLGVFVGVSKDVDDGLTKMIKGGGDQTLITQQLNKAFRAYGVDLDRFKVINSETTKALEEQGIKVTENESGLLSLSGGAADAANKMDVFGQAATDASDAVAAATEEELDALHKRYEAYDEAAMSFVNYSDIISSATEDAARRAADAAGEPDAWQDYAEGVKLALSDVNAALEEQVNAGLNWQTNMNILAQKVPQTIIDQLARMGPEGVPLVQALVDGSDEELQKFVSLALQGGIDGTIGFGQGIVQGRPLVELIAQEFGQGAADKAAESLRNGTATVQQIAEEYGISIEGVQPELKVETADALARIAALRATAEAMPNVTRTITYVGNAPNGAAFSDAREGYAYGGYTGPGPRFEPAGVVHRGEYVIDAPTVNRFGGPSYFDRLRQAAMPGFSAGGSVGRSAATSPSGLVELGPKSLARLQRNIINNIENHFSPTDISTQARRGNQSRRKRGA